MGKLLRSAGTLRPVSLGIASIADSLPMRQQAPGHIDLGCGYWQQACVAEVGQIALQNTPAVHNPTRPLALFEVEQSAK